MITQEKFGKIEDRPVYRYWLENKHQTKVAILSLAGIIQQFIVVTPAGPKNLVVSLPDATAYTKNPFQLCKQIGRVAGRIADGTAMVNKRAYRLPQNEGKNTLHGGKNGLSTKVLDGEILGDTLRLTTEFKQQEDGFPADAQFMIDYHLDDNNQLTMTYHATALGDTLIDPTMHIYWDLGAAFDKTRLFIPNNKRLEVNEEKLPTGAVYADEHLFTFPQTLRSALDYLALNGQTEIDDAFVVKADAAGKIAQLQRVDGININVLSKRNGLVVFTANPLAPDKPFSSVALEAQTLPDAVHHHKFGNVAVAANHSKSWQIAYQIDLPQN